MILETSEFAALWAQLLKDKEFRTLDTNESRISYIFKNVKPLNEFREEITKKINEYQENHGKSAKTSQKHRENGDNLLVAKNYIQAIHSYTYALLYAPFPTQGDNCKELQKCYTARSIAFSRVGDYSNALFDANKSLFLGSTVEMLSHKAYCLRFLRRFDEAKRLVDGVLHSKEYYKTQTTPELMAKFEELQEVLNKEVVAYDSEREPEEKEREQDYDVWIDQKFELKSTPEKGRHLVAKEKIEKGEVVIAERPQTAVLSAANSTSFCNCCFKRVGYQFWPCVWCSEVVFCDRTCHDRGISVFHQYECKMTGLLLQSPFYQTFRTITRIGAEHAFKTATNTEKEAFDLQKWMNRFYGRDCPVVYRQLRDEYRHHFEGQLTLVDHNDKVTAEDAAKQALMAIQLALMMEHKKSFVTYEEQTFVSFVAFVVKMFRKTVTNSFGWNYKTPNSANGLNVGSCVTLYGSFVNHSCVPNMSWHFFEEKIIFSTIRDVEAGEELCICYGPNGWMPLEQRQQILRNHYHFTCNCELCLLQVRKYPALKCLKCEGPVLFVPNTQRDDNNACLNCGSVYDNIKEVVNRVAYLRLEYEEALRTVEILQRKEVRDNNQNEDQFDDVEEDNTEKSDDGSAEEKSDSKGNEKEEKKEMPEEADNESVLSEEELSPEKWEKIESSLKKAEESLQTLIDLHYSKCEEIFDLELKIAKSFVSCDKYSDAVQHVQRFVSLVDWSKCAKSCRHWEGLLFITNAYYMHLKNQTVADKSDWKQCFKSFSALKESYKVLKEDSEAVKTLKIDGKLIGNETEKFKDVMREKKAHLTALKDVYKSLFTV